MRRADFLKLTGLTVDNHKNLVRRDLMPVSELEESPTRPSGWSYYTESAAFETLLALEVAKAGVDQRDATSTVVLGFGAFRKRFGEQMKEQKADIFFGAIRVAAEGGSLIRCTGGVLGNLDAYVDRIHSRDAYWLPLTDVARDTEKLVLVNVSRLLRQFRETAIENQIEIDFDWLTR